MGTWGSSESPADGDAGPLVLVVGAGPTGLLMASELVRRHVDCLLIDAHDAPLGWDRATVVHTRSIEIFEALGLANEIIDPAVKVRGSRLRSDGQALGVMDLALADNRYGFDLGLSEDVIETVLTGYLEAHGGVVTRSTRLVRIDTRPDGVVATIEQNGARRVVMASWVVGCDGHASTTRELAGIEYRGADLEAPWAVFDATLEGWDEEFDMIFAHFDIPSVILSPLPGRRWRVYVRPTSETSDIVSDATVTIRRYAPSAEFVALENPSRFHCHSRVATRFRSGRVLLAGDAAHSCSPSEGHGMNTGLQDAFNLGWKLALACRGIGGTALLDSYEAERRPIALRIVASGNVFESNQTMQAPSDRRARDEGVRGTLADPSSAHHEAVAAAELDRSYAGSDLVAGDKGDYLSPGDLLPNTALVEPAAVPPCALHELTHRLGHTLLVLGGRGVDGEEFLKLVITLEAAYEESPAIDAVVGLCVQPAGPRIGRIDQSVADRLGVEAVTILAVRPDRFIGFRQDGRDPRALAAYFEVFTNQDRAPDC